MIRAALVGVLVGMLLGGGTVGGLAVYALWGQTAELQAMALDVHAIRKYSNINAEAVLDGAVRADAMAQARMNAMKLPIKAVAKKLKPAR